MSLIGCDADAIRALAAGGTARVRDVEVTWPEDDRRMPRYRLAALEADPASAPYLLHVLLEGDRLVARIGCHEGPRDGAVEIGYYVAPAYRGVGLATAVLAEFLGWLADRGVRRVRASVGPDNVASRALLARAGFAQVGEHWDDEDGHELEVELPLASRRLTG